jgi:hypothetical protein
MPTPLPTNAPKPDFAQTGPALRIQIDAAVIVGPAAVLLKTVSPTPSPTPYPTEKGHEAAVEKKDVPALKTALAFAVNVDDGNLAAMKQATKEGVGSSIGLQASSVLVAGVQPSRQQRSPQQHPH